MKYLIPLIAFLLANNNGFGQTNQYHKFLTDGAVWKELFITYTFKTDSITYIQPEYMWGDTLLNGKLYKKMATMLFLEDSINRKVYVRDYGLDWPDTLLYDFNLEVGESAAHCAEFSVGNLFPDATVVNIDSFLIGTYRKRWEIKYTPRIENGDSVTYWIEGVGSDNGIFNPYSSWYWPDSRKLICYSEHDTLLYSDLQYWYDCDEVFEDSTDNIAENVVSSGLKILPNPANEFAKVYWSHCQIYGINQISVFDAEGRIIINDVCKEDECTLDCSNWFSGVYFIVLSNDQSRGFAKLLVMH